MNILSLKDAATDLGTKEIANFFSGSDWSYPDIIPSLFLPKDPSHQIALARVVANTFLDRGSTILWITEFGIWDQQMDLFSRYRLSYGEKRTLADAPVHMFDPKQDQDRDAFISILCLGLFFGWGFEIVTLNRTLAVTVSHDEWLEYRFSKGNENFISYFDKWIKPILREGSLPSR